VGNSGRGQDFAATKKKQCSTKRTEARNLKRAFNEAGRDFEELAELPRA
jgi:hypothetical protein